MATKKKMLQAAAGVGGDIGAWDLDYVYYDDPLEWDITQANYRWIKDVSAQDGGPRDVYISPDGTKAYMLGTIGDKVYEYNINTPFRINGLTYVQSFYVGSQENGPNGLFFKPDGTKFYIVGSTTRRIHEYDLSTAWDISTASYSQQSIAVGGGGIPSGMFFRQDGTMVYIADYLADRVYQYSLSTAWDVSTVAAVNSFSTAPSNYTPYGISFKPDGTKMYLANNGTDTIGEYDLSTAWDITTAVYSQALTMLATQGGDPTGIFIHPENGYLYVVRLYSPVAITQYSLGGFSVAGQSTLVVGIFFKPDGTKMYTVANETTDRVYEYDLSTPWDTSTASYLQFFNIGAQETFPRDLFFKPDGTKMYIVGTGGDDVNEYSLGTAWDISTSSYSTNFRVASQTTVPTSISFKPDGTKMYIGAGGVFHEYDLSTPWSVSTASYLQSSSFFAQVSQTEDIVFKPDGYKFFVLENLTDAIHEFDLSTPWDVSTLSYTSKKYINQTRDSVTQGFSFDESGTKLFIFGGQTDRVVSFSLGVQT